MPKSKIYQPPKGKGTGLSGLALGIGASGLLFLAIPLTQIFNEYEKKTEEIMALEVAPPPPPPPPEDPPPPPEPEKEEPPPELDTPPPPISLDQLDMALDPGTGGSMAGDFALPSFDVSGSDLGGVEIFELGDVDSPPQPRTRIEFSYPSAAKRKGITGTVRVEYIVSEKGRVEDIKIVDSPDRLLSDATSDVLRRVRFEPATKSGRAVKVRMRASVPYR
ncbi:MAG: energy transducer TonB [Opitutales bacterium]